MNDRLGERMKSFYEQRTRYFLPRRTHTIIRLDGKAFSTYTKYFKKPFDPGLNEVFNRTVCMACALIQGVKFGYYQSDEISLLLTDFDEIKTDAWYDGNLQKIVSVSASIVTAIFNSLMHKTMEVSFTDEKNLELPPAFFDSRAFTIPEKEEVTNYFIWRQRDCTRNSILALGYSVFSHKQMMNKNTTEVLDMLRGKGVDWNALDHGLRYGSVIYREAYELESPETSHSGIIRSKWISTPAPLFTADRDFSFIEKKEKS